MRLTRSCALRSFRGLVHVNFGPTRRFSFTLFSPSSPYARPLPALPHSLLYSTHFSPLTALRILTHKAKTDGIGPSSETQFIQQKQKLCVYRRALCSFGVVSSYQLQRPAILTMGRIRGQLKLDKGQITTAFSVRRKEAQRGIFLSCTSSREYQPAETLIEVT